MRHVRRVTIGRVGKRHHDFARRAGRDRRDVFPAGAIRLGWLAVLRQDAELASVQVHRMQHPVLSLGDAPARRLVAGPGEIDPAELKGFAVDAVDGGLLRQFERFFMSTQSRNVPCFSNVGMSPAGWAGVGTRALAGW